jgi:hypothetical protein
MGATEVLTKRSILSALLEFPQKVLILSLLILLSFPPAYGRDFAVRRNVDGYTLDVTIDQNPPILGKNDIRVEIRDSLGKYVVDVPVTVNYFMPPMPGMPPMNYTLKASPRGSGYSTTMDLTMKGPWNIVIRANVAGKQLRMTVLIDVR